MASLLLQAALALDTKGASREACVNRREAWLQVFLSRSPSFCLSLLAKHLSEG
jgi:hypothetical protein